MNTCIQLLNPGQIKALTEAAWHASIWYGLDALIFTFHRNLQYIGDARIVIIRYSRKIESAGTGKKSKNNWQYFYWNTTEHKSCTLTTGIIKARIGYNYSHSTKSDVLFTLCCRWIRHQSDSLSPPSAVEETWRKFCTEGGGDEGVGKHKSGLLIISRKFSVTKIYDL